MLLSKTNKLCPDLLNSLKISLTIRRKDTEKDKDNYKIKTLIKETKQWQRVWQWQWQQESQLHWKYKDNDNSIGMNIGMMIEWGQNEFDTGCILP